MAAVPQVTTAPPDEAVPRRRWGPGGGDPAVGTGARAGDGRAGDGRGAGRDEGGGG